MCKNMAQPSQATDDNILQRRNDVTGMLDNSGYRHMHSDYVTVTALPRQQWLSESTFILCHTHVYRLIYHWYTLLFSYNRSS
jgi:hypothetical protein